MLNKILCKLGFHKMEMAKGMSNYFYDWWCPRCGLKTKNGLVVQQRREL